MLLRATIAPIGMPEAMPLAMQTTSGSMPQCSIANILPVRPMPDCTSSMHQRDLVAVAEVAQRGIEVVCRDNVAAFALDRFHEYARYFVGRHQVAEHGLLDVVHAGPAQLLGSDVKWRAVGVREGSLVGARRQRLEARAVEVLAA